MTLWFNPHKHVQYFYSEVWLAKQLSRHQSEGRLHPCDFRKAFLEEEDKKQASAAVTRGHKSLSQCVCILSNPDLVMFSCAKELKRSNWAFMLTYWSSFVDGKMFQLCWDILLYCLGKSYWYLPLVSADRTWLLFFHVFEGCLHTCVNHFVILQSFWTFGTVRASHVIAGVRSYAYGV